MKMGNFHKNPEREILRKSIL